MAIKYIPKGVCSREISFDLQDGIVTNVSFTSGCDGNLQGISKLVTGMKATEVIEKLRGINCCGKGTSCPDQLARALEEALQAKIKDKLEV